MMIEFFYLFFGYIVGRVGHFCINPLMKFRRIFLHHWILGLVLMLIGAILDVKARNSFFFFGAGVFISDIIDFMKLKIYEPDKPGKLRFWHFD